MFTRFRLFGRKATPIVPVPEVSEPRTQAGKLEALVMQEYRSVGLAGLTPDECAYRLGRGILSVRPATTRLMNDGKLRRTGSKRHNYSGLKAHVLVAA